MYYMTEEELAILTIRIKMTNWVLGFKTLAELNCCPFPFPMFITAFIPSYWVAKVKKWGNFPFFYSSTWPLAELPACCSVHEAYESHFDTTWAATLAFLMEKREEILKLHWGEMITEGTLSNCCQLCRNWLSKRKRSAWNISSLSPPAFSLSVISMSSRMCALPQWK